MISRLHGILLELQPPRLLIDVGGVGYELEAPLSVFDRLPALGEPLTLLTQLIVREDAHTLYGFLNAGDRALFRALLKVSGVGPRLAMVILSGVSSNDFALMVESGDVQGLTRLPGIGKKTAARLLLEMRGRLSDLPAGQGSASVPADAAAEARAALTALGYSAAEALKMVRAVEAPDQPAAALIRAALKKRMAG